MIKVTSGTAARFSLRNPPRSFTRARRWKAGGTITGKSATGTRKGNASPYSPPPNLAWACFPAKSGKGHGSVAEAPRAMSSAKLLRSSGKIVRARAYITALGYYELRMNGEKVGKNVLDPAWTTYPQAGSLHHLRLSLRPCAGPERDWSHAGRRMGNSRQCFCGWNRAILQIPGVPAPDQYRVGRRQKISVASDGSWKTTRGPILSDSVYDGEVYDARRETPGWDAPGFDDSAWSGGASGGGLARQSVPLR